MLPVVPPKSNRIQPWEYDRALYKKRNEIERLFRRLKGIRRIFSRFEKLDVIFLAFLQFALIIEALRLVRREKKSSNTVSFGIGRRSTVEHPFATIKYRIFGHPRLLMRGLSGARIEIGIATMALGDRPKAAIGYHFKTGHRG